MFSAASPDVILQCQSFTIMNRSLREIIQYGGRETGSETVTNRIGQFRDFLLKLQACDVVIEHNVSTRSLSADGRNCIMMRADHPR